MTLVRIIKNWDWPDLMRQTPGHRGAWNGIQFSVESIESCDYAIVLNRVPEETQVYCPPQQVWSVMQEPPNERFKLRHRGSVSNYRVYTQDSELRGQRYLLSHGAISWHVNKSYDYLASCNVPEKEQKLSWVTSNKTVFQGHRDRMCLLERIRGKIECDLYGYGFNPIADKWDGLAPYRYSIAVENFQNPYYWSEKLADCFLAWTMPIYFGCSRIEEYFPAEAMIRMDIDDPMVVEKVEEVLSNDIWHRNLDAIAEARKLVLERYQLFPFIAQEIADYERDRGSNAPARKTIILTRNLISPSITERDYWRMVGRQISRTTRSGKKILRRLLIR